MDAPPDERYARYANAASGEPELGSLVKAVVADAKSYFEAQKELTTLELGEKLGRAAAVALLALVLALVASAAVLMGSVALALWLGSVIGSVALGFLAVAGLDVLVGAVFFWLWRGVLKDKITLAVIRSMHGTS